jgi:hypothetical protein
MADYSKMMTINLCNLLPVRTLDGGRAFHAFSRTQRFIAAGGCLAAYFLVRAQHSSMHLRFAIGIQDAVRL